MGQIVLVAFGDSTTAPRQVNGRNLTVYADHLRREFGGRGLVVVNSGAGGNDTTMARARFEKDVLAHKPRIAAIQFGINDSAINVWNSETEPRVSIDVFEANIRFFVSQLRQRDCNVILMTPNPLYWTDELRKLYGKPPYMPDEFDGFSVTLDPYADRLRQIRPELGCEFLDIHRLFREQVARDRGMARDLLLDGMHPSDRGHTLVADSLVPAVRSLIDA